MKAMKMSAVVVAVLLAAALSGFAAEPKGWQFEVTPYVWAAGLEGDATVQGHTVDFEKKFTDMIKYVDAAVSILGVAQYDRFLLWGQMDYISMTTDRLDADERPHAGSLDAKMLLGEVAVGYQFDGFAEGQTFDVLVGARGLTMKTDLNVYDKGTFSKESNLLDPIIVLRPSIPVFPSKIKGLRFNPTVAIGGGGDSDLVYELEPQFQYQITPNVVARLGYRTVGYKFKGDHNSDNELNIRLSGLIAGVGVTF
jgi:hypothetical protein